MELWAKILLGLVAVAAIFMFRPGIKAAFEQSRQAEHKDWMGVLVPVVVVILFVLLLIAMVR